MISALAVIAVGCSSQYAQKINSDRNTIIKRLNHRKGYVTQKYMLDLEKYLEIDKNNYFINNKSHDTIDSITIQILCIQYTIQCYQYFYQYQY